MDVGSTLQKLGLFLEEFDEEVGTVTNVEFVDRFDSETGPTAEIELAIPAFSSRRRGVLGPDNVTVDSDGRLRVTLESAPLVPTTDPDFEIETTSVTIEDETITVVLSVSVATEENSTDGAEFGTAEQSPDPPTGSDDTDDTPAVDREREVPPFRDPELLTEVYESCDTFTEMREVIEMDVTAETVRRYMIDYGIHEPNSHADGVEDGDSSGRPEAGSDSDPSSRSGSDARPADSSEREQSSPVVLTDGIGLPEDVTAEALVETVSRSNTIYEVKQDLGLDRDETLELLRQLDLVDLVVGRVANESERRIGREEIVERLRQASVAQH
ncbi:hypothetical protein CV102_23105 [Natronococcus pandeyae]|uniref:Uncharacterized protein n=1 Tax=Natronococcus pandeyae TaxID=2055836 RepID=A0A8J8PZ70_9EURY|nr:hypothetical protein [Natronococcus pandeyae]TYL36347.1 hypothetical protein CV102_23105 [Natronococcus pandeyae]